MGCVFLRKQHKPRSYHTALTALCRNCTADQHLRFSSMDSTVSLLLNLLAIFLAVLASLCQTWLEIMKIGFTRTTVHLSQRSCLIKVCIVIQSSHVRNAHNCFSLNFECPKIWDFDLVQFVFYFSSRNH